MPAKILRKQDKNSQWQEYATYPTRQEAAKQCRELTANAEVAGTVRFRVIADEDVDRRLREAAEHTVKFAKTADEIEDVYKRSNRTCCTPQSARGYAGPDLAVAYIERDKQVLARCVVWPEKKLRSRIVAGYSFSGDYEKNLNKLRDGLDALGYHRDALAGARVEGNYLPVYDQECSLVKDGDYWRLRL